MWCGSRGRLLTENNLERFNQANGKGQSEGHSNQEPQSDQPEAPKSTQRSSRRNENATNNGAAQARGAQQTSRRSSRRYSAAPNDYTQSGNFNPQRATIGFRESRVLAQKSGAAEEEAACASQSKEQTVEASKNATDANPARSISKQSYAAATKSSQSKSATQNRSRKDSMFGGDAQTSKEVVTESQNVETSPASGAKAPTQPSSTAQPPASRYPTSPTEPGLPRGWERKVRVITKRWPDGREVREREVVVQPTEVVA